MPLADFALVLDISISPIQSSICFTHVDPNSARGKFHNLFIVACIFHNTPESDPPTQTINIHTYSYQIVCTGHVL